MGATHTICVGSAAHSLSLVGQSTPSDLSGAAAMAECKEALLKIQPGGFDAAVDCTGQTSVMKLAHQVVRPQGGRAVIVGNARKGDVIPVDPADFNQGRSLLGTWGGDNQPDEDFPRYIRMFRDGRLPLKAMCERIYSFESLNEALSDLQNGRILRPIVNLKI
jgi:S-(hydroxymethyl)glutathione dehydrogenase/alcohol dehydrogenase